MKTNFIFKAAVDVSKWHIQTYYLIKLHACTLYSRLPSYISIYMRRRVGDILYSTNAIIKAILVKFRFFFLNCYSEFHSLYKNNSLNMKMLCCSQFRTFLKFWNLHIIYKSQYMFYLFCTPFISDFNTVLYFCNNEILEVLMFHCK